MQQSDDENYVKFHQALKQNKISELQVLITKGLQSELFGYEFVHKVFETAIKCGSKIAIKRLLNSLPVAQYLNFVISSDNENAMKRFVEGDAIFMNKYFANSYPLHMAALHNATGICKYLIGLGSVDINKKNIYGTTPLLEACTFGHILIVKFLCEQSKIQINAIDELNQNAFHCACKLDDNIDVVYYLLNTWIDKNLKDINGNSAFDIACERDSHNIVRYLFRVSEAFKINIDDQNPHVRAYKSQHPRRFDKIST